MIKIFNLIGWIKKENWYFRKNILTKQLNNYNQYNKRINLGWVKILTKVLSIYNLKIFENCCKFFQTRRFLMYFLAPSLAEQPFFCLIIIGLIVGLAIIRLILMRIKVVVNLFRLSL